MAERITPVTDRNRGSDERGGKSLCLVILYPATDNMQFAKISNSQLVREEKRNPGRVRSV